MNQFLYFLFLLMMLPTTARSASDVVRMDVGEEKSISVPYSVTSTDISTYYWSNADPTAVEVISSSFSSIKVKVLKYVYNRVLLQLDYYRLSDSRRETYDLYIDIRTPEVSLSASPSGGRVDKGQIVTFTCQPNDVVIYYTLDGYTPTTNSTKYYSGITINKTCTLKAFASWGGVDTDIKEWNYIIDDDGLYISASPKGGTVKKGTVVTLSCDNSSADIYYTLDGSTPTESSTKYTYSGVTINENCTLKAKAYKDGKSSDVMTETYKLIVEPTLISVYLSTDYVAVGGSAQAYCSITPSDAKSEITWSSDDSNIATINSSGVISGWKVGYTYIRAKTENGISGKCKVLVKEVGVKLAAVGGDHSLIVKEDGSLWSCGNNEKYQLFFTNTASKRRFVNTGYNNIISIAAGAQNSFYVDNSGSLSGIGDLGCIGANVVKNRYGITTKALSVVYSSLTIYTIKRGGILFGLGYNTFGQLGNGKIQPSYKPIEMTNNVSKVSTDGYSVFVIKNDGSLWACGCNWNGKLGDGTEMEKDNLFKITNNVVSVASGTYHTLIVKSDGSLWGCGSSSNGQLCGTTDSKVPVKIMDDVFDVGDS